MATTIKFEPNRAYPSQPEPGADLPSHTNSLKLMREAIEIHERRTGNYLDSFVRVQELIDLGFITIEGNQLNNTVGGADGSGTHNDLSGRNDPDAHSMGAITGLNSSQGSQNTQIGNNAADINTNANDIIINAAAIAANAAGLALQSELSESLRYFLGE